MKLDDPAQMVPGVGPLRAKLLKKLDLHTVRDLLFFAPRDYRSYGDELPI